MVTTLLSSSSRGRKIYTKPPHEEVAKVASAERMSNHRLECYRLWLFERRCCKEGRAVGQGHTPWKIQGQETFCLSTLLLCIPLLICILPPSEDFSGEDSSGCSIMSGLEVKQLEVKLTLIWDYDAIGNGLTYWATMPALEIFEYPYLLRVHFLNFLVLPQICRFLSHFFI